MRRCAATADGAVRAAAYARAMKGRAYLLAFALGLVLLAVAGWTVEGARWALTGSRSRRPRLAAAG
jgi:hypothetical protein